jgi:hypothetical protein
MNLLNLDDLSREKFILALPDIIVLEHTNRELRDWINRQDIYRRWERKHWGKTDKWRLLLLQEIAIKRKLDMYFKHTEYRMSLGIEERNDGRFRIIFNRYNMSPQLDASVEDIRQKFKHYVHLELEQGTNLPSVRQYRAQIAVVPTSSRALYYFMYDLLRYGFEFVTNLDLDGYTTDGRFIRCHQVGEKTHQCSECAQKFCSDEKCPEWVDHLASAHGAI